MDRTVGSVLVVALVCTLGLALAVGAVGAEDEHDPIDLELGVTVTADGEIDEYDFTIEMDEEEYYEQLEQMPDEYDTLSEAIADSFLMQDEFEEVDEKSDTDLGDRYEVQVIIGSVDVSASDEMTVTTDDGVTLEFDGGDPPEDGDTVTLVVEMPGTVTDSNADEVDGAVATWYIHDSPPDIAFATTGDGMDDRDDGDGADDGDDGTGETDDGDDSDDGDGADDGDNGDDAEDGDEADDEAADEDGAPGFGVVAAVVALVSGLAFYRNRV